MSLFMDIGNAVMRILLQSPLHALLSANTLVLKVSGVKSGRVYAIPVNYVEDDDRLLISSMRERTWWRNLKHGAPVRVVLRGHEKPAFAEACTDPDEVTRLLGDYVRAEPSFARYFDIALEEDGTPVMADLARTAGNRVMVVVRMQ